MPLTAMISDELIDATFCSSEVWGSFYRRRPRVEILCRGCSHHMHAKISSQGQPFFAHDKMQDCPNTGESVEHLTLKRLFAESIREIGWTASLEATPGDSDAGGWRADVLAIDPSGSRRIAFEVQLSAMSIGEGRMRTDRYKQDQIETVWIANRRAAWLGHLLGIRTRAVGKKPPYEYSIDHGVMRFNDGKWSRSELRLGRVIEGVLTGSLVEHFAMDGGRGSHGYVLVPKGDIERSRTWIGPDTYLGIDSDDPRFKEAREQVTRRFQLMDEIRAQWKGEGWI